ncbi:MAG: PfkB family carbohydrate kinase [Actinomycetota bacterium]
MTEASERPTVLSFGESVIDIYPDRRVVAGSPVHLAAHLARRGWRALLATRVGDDDDGSMIRSTIARHGVSEKLVEVDPDLPTGTVTISLNETGHSFEIHNPVAWDQLELKAPLPEADAVCYGSLIGRSEIARSALFRLLDEGRYPVRVFDVNLRPPDVHLETVRRGLRAATVIKISDEEFGDLAAALDLDGEDELFATGLDLQWLAISRGARGARLLHRSGDSWTRAAETVEVIEVVDAVGAGDAFTGGLVDALARDRSGDQALGAAMSAAESILGQRGGLPPG